jgi:ankyrin repeat protein
MDDERIAELLLQNGASPDFGDKRSGTPLAWAIENRKITFLRLLLARGAKIDYIYLIVSESNCIWIGPSQIDC